MGLIHCKHSMNINLKKMFRLRFEKVVDDRVYDTYILLSKAVA